MHVTIYLNFPGQAEEAIQFYKETLGAEVVMLSRMKEAPMDIPKGLEDKIMHARIKVGNTMLFLSDTFDPSKMIRGNNVSLALEVDSPENVDKTFALLSAGGKATMPPNDAFWGSRFSMLVDKYGVHWMVSCELKK